MAEPLARQFGRYTVLAEIGRGAMGVVYKAEDALLNRQVAIKTVLLSSDEEERAEYEARFYQEAKACAGLNHPNIITIYDAGREGDVAYMAMELLNGVELRDLMKLGNLPLPHAIDYAAQVAEGLGFAHEHGVVHRDIKPGNIMIVHGKLAKIMDFGIARVRVSDVKTQAGTVLGSPKYMSAEQAAGQRADHRSDIFSLGVVLYEMVTGRAPFNAPDVAQLLHQIATAVAPAPTAIKPSLPAVLDLIVAKVLAKDPAARYQDARELARDLLACNEQLAAPPAPVAGGDAYEKTVKVDFASGKTTAAGEQVYDKTLKLDRQTPSPQIDQRAPRTGSAETTTVNLAPLAAGRANVPPLSLSRRFDSAEAITMIDAHWETDADSIGVMKRARLFLNDSYRRKLAYLVAAAIFAGVLIAFI